MKKYKLNILFYSITLIFSTNIQANMDFSGSGGSPNTIMSNVKDYIVVGENNTLNHAEKNWIFGYGNGSEFSNNITMTGSDNEVTDSKYISLTGSMQYSIYTSFLESMGNFNEYYNVDYAGIVGSHNIISSFDHYSKYVYGMGNLNRIGTAKDSSYVNFLSFDSNLEGSHINAMGDNLYVYGDNNILMGSHATLLGQKSIGLGYKTLIDGNNSVAIGSNSAALADYSTAVGSVARADAVNSVAIGHLAIVASGHDESIALGYKSEATGASLLQKSYLTNETATSELNIANGASQRRITGVAAGALDTDAVNVAQLKAATNFLMNGSNTALLENNGRAYNSTLASKELLFDQVSADSNGSTTQSASAGDRVMTRVAKGNIAADSTDAVTGSQLNTTNQAITSYLGGGAGYDNITQSFNQPTYNIGSNNYNNVGDALGALNQADIDTNHRIDNIEQSVNHSINNINKNMDDLRKESRSGIAAAMAVGSLPQPSQAGKSMISAAASTYRGEEAFALGMSGITPNDKYIYKVGAGVDTKSSVSGSVAVGYQW